MQSQPYPLISVLTCTYNSEKFLEQALRSVEVQTYAHIEHIINDSFSSDRTLEIIQAYIRRNQGRYPIRLIQSEPQGVANALNVITTYARGDVVHYLHSDDYYVDATALERAAAYFTKDPSLMWITGNFLVEIKNRQIVIPQTHLLRINPYKVLSAMNIIHHENTFVKREVITDYGGFNENKRSVVEYGIWLHLIEKYEPLILNEEFTVFIVHPGSTSTGSVLKFSQAILRAFYTQKQEKVFPFIGYYPDNDFYLLYRRLVEQAQLFIDLFDFDNLLK